jgi:hypothetical protein
MVLTIAVIGSRNFEPLSKVKEYLDQLKVLIPEFWIISGGAQGVDSAAVLWGDANEMQYKVVRPRNEGRSAEYLYRNVEMIAMSDAVVAFWDGKSTGTAFGMQYAKDRNKPLKVIKSDDKAE